MLKFSEFILLEKSLKINMNHRDLSKHLQSVGWSLERQNGEHDVWKHSQSFNKIAVPRHKGDLAPGTVRKILTTARLVDA